MPNHDKNVRRSELQQRIADARVERLSASAKECIKEKTSAGGSSSSAHRKTTAKPQPPRNFGGGVLGSK